VLPLNPLCVFCKFDIKGRCLYIHK
jgi:hypothetical protein